MKIRSLSLKNFRAYKNIKVIFDENMNVIIGQNDIGKSTILEALDIFFGQEVIKIDITDWNKYKEENKITIGIEFIIDDKLEVIIDSANPTKLQDEYLVNQDGYLEVFKEFNVDDEKLSKEKIYISAFYPQYFEIPLVNIKIKDLRNHLNDIKDDLPNYDDINKNRSADIRQALYRHHVVQSSPFENKIIDLQKDGAKSIWESLQKELPLYFLFQSDRANKDSDSDIQNPLKTATKRILSDFEEEFKIMKNKLETQLNKIGIDTINKMKEMGLDVADDLVPKVTHKPLDTLFSFNLESDDGIALNKRGSGFRRMVMLNYFRAEAERKIFEKNNKHIIYAIEEPETAQHPNHQKMLIEALLELSNKDFNQIIITTHTPEIAKLVDENHLILITKDANNNRNPISDSEHKLKTISDTLGLHPSFNSKVVVCLEGEFDIKFLTNVNQTINEYRNIIDLKKENISLIPLQGSNLKSWVNRHYLKSSNVIEVHIYDSDIGSGKNSNRYKAEHDEINARNDNSVCFITNKREMENYIHKSLIEKKFNITLDSIINYDTEDIPTFIKNKTSYNEKSIKGILNGQLTTQITKEQLEDINAYNEIKCWFEKIAELSK